METRGYAMKHTAHKWGTVAMLAVALGCQTADTGDPEPTVQQTPEQATNPFTNEDYAVALRSAAVKLTGSLPEGTDVQDVLDEGRPAYEALIDQYVDSPQLVVQMRDFVARTIGLGAEEVTVPDPVTGDDVVIDLDGPSDLAAFVIATDRPWTEILTADYCVSASYDAETHTVLFDDTMECANVPQTQRAGMFSQQAFLYAYGQTATHNFQRTSVLEQFVGCGIYPVGDFPLERNNAPLDALPADDPSLPRRIHTKYQGTMVGDGGNTVTCALCHSALLARRTAFTKFDRNGFYDASRTIEDVELPEDNANKCYVVPFGTTAADLTPCSASYDPAGDTYGCCYDPEFTDPNSFENLDCYDPGEPCTGNYLGASFSSLREYAQLHLDGSLNRDGFYDCQTRRFYDFAIGSNTGSMSISAAVGDLPAAIDGDTLEKYGSLFAHEDYNVRELLRALFKGDEYLHSQAQ